MAKISHLASSFAEPSMYPLHRCKILHAVRHGQGFHNIAGDKDIKQYESWDYMDASLSELGWQQAEALHAHMVKTHIRHHVELVVVSPLLRTLQTAVGVWGGGTLLPGEPPHSALMGAQVGQYQHLPVSSAGYPPFVANEWCREQNGIHPCDKRSTISSYKASFPAIDFTQVETDEDTWWQATNRETQDEILTRARVFLKWILDRTETRIGVVSHSSFLYHLVHLFGDDCSDTVRRELQTGFRNCEMRSFTICDRRATAVSKAYNTDFRGGLFFKGQMTIEKAGKDGNKTRVEKHKEIVEKVGKEKGKQKEKQVVERLASYVADEIAGEEWIEVAKLDDLAASSGKHLPSASDEEDEDSKDALEIFYKNI